MAHNFPRTSEDAKPYSFEPFGFDLTLFGGEEEFKPPFGLRQNMPATTPKAKQTIPIFQIQQPLPSGAWLSYQAPSANLTASTLTSQSGHTMSPHSSEVTSSSGVAVALMPVEGGFQVIGNPHHGHHQAIQATADVGVTDMDFWDLDFGSAVQPVATSHPTTGAMMGASTTTSAGGPNNIVMFQSNNDPNNHHVRGHLPVMGSTALTIVNVNGSAVGNMPVTSPGVTFGSVTVKQEAVVMDDSPTTTTPVTMGSFGPSTPLSGRASSHGGYGASGSVAGNKRRYYPSPGSAGLCDSLSDQGELSPGSTLDGFPTEASRDGSLSGASGSLFDKRNKKGPATRQQEELCLVCGDRASGYHYNALTCEGCKGFFRRSITKNAVYQCKYGNHCEIDMYMRRKCQECRLKKCLNVGMRPECVVPEYQCAVKREAKKAQKDRDKPNSTTNGSPEAKYQVEEQPAPVETQLMKRLSPEQEELINRLVFYQEEFEQPTKDDVERVPEFSVEADDEQGKFRHIAELTILTVQLIVEFSKRLPGFDTLLREDQITLLKACSSEVMMLRTARRYDINTDSIVFANNQPYTRDQYASSGLSGVPDTLFPFCRYLCLMKVDNAEYALLTAIVVFSERPNLIDPKKVEKIQEIYISALRSYEDSKRPKPALSFAKLLAVLPQLRTLGNINSEICFSLKIQNKKIPPFLAEIWDV